MPSHSFKPETAYEQVVRNMKGKYDSPRQSCAGGAQEPTLTSGSEPSAVGRYLPLLMECNRLVYDVPVGTRGAAIRLRETLDTLATEAEAGGWQLIESAPRDGTWFEASDGHAVRRVQFADRHDRLPTGDGRVWASLPWLWRPLAAAAPQARTETGGELGPGLNQSQAEGKQ